MSSTVVIGLGLRKKMIINTISNYGKMLVGLFITIFLTRILFLGLTREEYGFWALLWSIFGYSLLLDFGFGTSVQKYTSECNTTKDWNKFNRIVSTIFFNYIFFAGLIAIFSIVLSYNLQRIFTLNSSTITYYKSVMIIFGIGSSLTFPFGFYTEILRGLQRMHARNLVQITFIILNFIGMATMIHYHFNLIGMACVAISTNLGANLTMMYIVHRLLPDFKISWNNYDRSLLKSVMGFSIYAYLITFTNLIIMKTDQLVISIFGSVAMVAVYQISIRLADTFQKFSSQFLDNLGPVSANLFASGNKSKMTEVMLQSNRLMGMISTLLLIPLVVFIKPLLNIWLKLSDTAGLICALILLLSMYILLFFRSSTVYVLLMANEHKLLARIAIIEAIANLGLSILLLHYLPNILQYWGLHINNSAIIGVSIGTLIPNFILAFTFNIPQACKFSKITIKEYLQTVVSKTLIVGLLGLAFTITLYKLYYPGKLIIVFFYTLIYFVIYGLLTYTISLKKWEKQQVKSFLQNHYRNKKM